MGYSTSDVGFSVDRIPKEMPKLYTIRKFNGEVVGRGKSREDVILGLIQSGLIGQAEEFTETLPKSGKQLVIVHPFCNPCPSFIIEHPNLITEKCLRFF